MGHVASPTTTLGAVERAAPATIPLLPEDEAAVRHDVAWRVAASDRDEAAVRHEVTDAAALVARA